MLLSNKKIDTFLAKFWLLHVKTVKIMCDCYEYPLKQGMHAPADLQDITFYTRRILTDFITGKSLSEALIFASTNPQYDNRLFI